METTPNRNILLLEDNELNAQILKMYLKRLGMQVEWFDNEDDALDAVLSGKYVFDFVLLDHQLDIESGDEWINRLRTKKPDFELPVISTSAHLLNKEILNNLKVGVAGFLQKPIMDKDLRRLEQHIRQTEYLWKTYHQSSKSNLISLESLNLGMLPKAQMVDFWLDYGFERLSQLINNQDFDPNELSGLLGLAKWYRFFGLYAAGKTWQIYPGESQNKQDFECELKQCWESLEYLKLQMMA